MKKRKSSERLAGLLVMLPWLFERGRANIDDMAATFGVDRETLIADLTLASLCGTPPYSPAELIDVIVDEDEVYVGMTQLFTRPLRLTVEEAFTLKAIGEAALAVTGGPTSSALASALAKLPNLTDDDSVVVQQPSDPNVGELTDCALAREVVTIKYFKPQVRLRSRRDIVPMRLWTEADHWYVDALDSKSGGLRVFRVDRITSMKRTGRTVEAKSLPELPGEPGFNWSSDTEEVTVRLRPAAQWVVERYPNRGVKKLANGDLEVTLQVSSPEWLGRLLVRAGADASVVGSTRHSDLAARTAEKILSRYA